MRFKGLDLNLLVKFNALMTMRSVSCSAERINLSPPALSAALARLDYGFASLIVPLVALLVGHCALATAPIPFEIPQMKQILSYHPRRKDDAGMTWRRSLIKAIARVGA